MRLCIPCRQVQHELAALWFGLVEIRIRLRERAEEFAIVTLEMDAKSSIESMTRFMTQYAHALRIGASFNFEHLPPFKSHQPWMSEIKRNGDAWHAVGREPFFGQPDMRLETYAARIKLVVKTLDMRLEERVADLYVQVADARIQQLLI